MIRPVNFGFNAETAINNAFQVESKSDDDINAKATQEFDAFVKLLREEGVEVMAIEDTPDPYTPDSIFPNNWISFHNDGTVFLYPMFAANRRLERKLGVLTSIEQQFTVTNTIDFSNQEEKNLFLEGTGSMVLDRDNRVAYASISPRTNIFVLDTWCRQTGYTPVSFHAKDINGNLIYHTNVMMCVADQYVVVCLDSIKDKNEREGLINAIDFTGKIIIEISLEQMNHFAGNMLQVHNKKGEKLLVMSSQAYQSLTSVQIKDLSRFNRIIHSPLSTIESNGGGSARCMMAEIHLPKK